MNVLLSIKPKYVEKIFSGEKIYEYRKIIPNRKNIKKVIIYSSSPISAIVGEFEIDRILKDTPSKLWKKTKNYSGISHEFYQKYFNNSTHAYAFKLKNVVKYSQPRKISEFGDFHSPPQSFFYISD
ncbi:ASCH domain-containing protein [Avibacterium paragallinarum]|uniref:ASCH domain-containing protein n=1 Tax=Avibacterium paragallinarum TaxID=728 RepID=UPI00397E5095